MGFSKTLLLIVTLSCLLIHTIALPLPASSLGDVLRRRVRSPQMMVSNLCRNITNPSLCMSTILPAIKAPFNPHKALEAEILYTKSKVVTAKEKIDMLLLNRMMSKDLNESLYICKDQYGNMLDSIKQSLIAMSTPAGPTEAKYKLSSVVSYLETCKDNFDKKYNPSPLSQEYSLLSALVSNCLDIIKKLEDKQMNRVLRRFGGKLPPPPPAVATRDDPCFNVIGLCSYN